MKLTYDLKLRDNPRPIRLAMGSVSMTTRKDCGGGMFRASIKSNEDALRDAIKALLDKLNSDKNFFHFELGFEHRIVNIHDVQSVNNFLLEDDDISSKENHDQL
jgi:hypothetical protein